jgi:CDP-paratose 2-epimerase
MRVLVTGGAGFIGASTALGLQTRHPDWELLAFDNLRRRGSELNLSRLRAAGVRFAHGDVRQLDDLLVLPPFDAMVECSAEPSVLAGVEGSPGYLVHSNLTGAYHCLEAVRRHGAQIVFLSTSRVYPVAALSALALTESETRFELAPEQPVPGASPAGISEAFPLAGARTLYGATKLAAELLIEEYRETYGVRAVIDRCGVVAGPWQMGKVDQGVFTYWMLAHHFRRPLRYIGFGGAGRQVRDLLHVEDLVDLIDLQLTAAAEWDGFAGNVGGGREISLSLRETTELCAEITGAAVDVTTADESRPGDVPVYISDCARLFARTDWRPQRGAREILADIHRWIRENEAAVRGAL